MMFHLSIIRRGRIEKCRIKRWQSSAKALSSCSAWLCWVEEKPNRSASSCCFLTVATICITVRHFRWRIPEVNNCWNQSYAAWSICLLAWSMFGALNSPVLRNKHLYSNLEPDPYNGKPILTCHRYISIGNVWYIPIYFKLYRQHLMYI